MLEILTIENYEEQLRKRSTELDPKKELGEARKIIGELKEILRANNKLKGLTAPQVGINRRVFVINFNGEYKSFINPLINKYTNAYFSTETSISIPNKEYLMLRYHEIEFYYTTPLGKAEGGKLRGIYAQIFQQLYDQLDGIFISDLNLENTDEIKALTPAERQEFFEGVAESLELPMKNLKTSVIDELLEEKQKVESAEELTSEVKEELIKSLDERISSINGVQNE